MRHIVFLGGMAIFESAQARFRYITWKKARKNIFFIAVTYALFETWRAL